MSKETCTVCAFKLSDSFCCPACDAAEAIIAAGGCHPNYHELLAEQIGNLLMARDWKTVIQLRNIFPRFA
jgi:putative intracellular protease/amidase